MRLINVQTLKLEEFIAKPPSYAILSHTWGEMNDEVTYQELQSGNLRATGKGRDKVVRCCQQAEIDGYKYAWIDTCCIDKTNLVELSEAINSMFRWYQEAAICYAYLDDVNHAETEDKENEGIDLHSDFFKSRWFKRGWTLQELLAPRELMFFDKTWAPISAKAQLAGEVEAITGIPCLYFASGADELENASVAQRMSWAAHRNTTREEDQAYCLLGIFSVSMSMIYGEGGARAFARLQNEILQRNGDTSIFAWGLGLGPEKFAQGTEEFWARSPAAFSGCGNIVVRNEVPMTVFNLSAGRLQTNLQLLIIPDPVGPVATYMSLKCGPVDNPAKIVGIQLYPIADAHCEYTRSIWNNGRVTWGGSQLLHLPPRHKTPRPLTIVIRMSGFKNNGGEMAWQRRVSLRYARHWLGIVGAAPANYWRNSVAWLPTSQNTNRYTYVARLRLRDSIAMGRDLVIVMLWGWKGDVKQPAFLSMMSISRASELDDVIKSTPRFRPEAFGQHSVSIGEVFILAVLQEKGDRVLEITLRLLTGQSAAAAAAAAAAKTVDADVEMRYVHEQDEYVRLLIEKYLQAYCLRQSAERIGDLRTAVTTMQTSVLASAVQTADIAKKNDELQCWKEANLVSDEALRYLTAKGNDIVRHNDQLGQTEGPGNWLDNLLHHMVSVIHVNEVWLRQAEIYCIRMMESKVDITLHGCSSLSYEYIFASQHDVRKKLNDILNDQWKGKTYYDIHCKDSGDHDDNVYEGYDTHVRDLSSRSAVSWLARNGFTAEARMLIERGADVDGLFPYYRVTTPLILAAANGHEDTVRMLLKHGANIEAANENDIGPLHHAVRGNHMAIVQLLIDSGAYVKGIAGCFCLKNCRDEEMTVLLEKNGAGALVDGDWTDNGYDNTPRNFTPLVRAAEDGQERVVMSLISQGAAKDPASFKWALRAAAIKEHVSIVQLLLLSITTDSMPARSRRRISTIALFETLEYRPWVWRVQNINKIVQLLVEIGDADVSGCDHSNRLPFHYALQNGFEDAAIFLLERGLNVNRAISGDLLHANFPLHYSAMHGFYWLAWLLLFKGVDVNMLDKQGRTALSLTDNDDIRCLLLSNGARNKVASYE